MTVPEEHHELRDELKQLIITSLALEDVTPDEIEAEAPLFGEGLGLDSIDALELALAISKKYGIKMDGDTEEVRKHFASVDVLASFIASRRKPTAGAS